MPEVANIRALQDWAAAAGAPDELLRGHAQDVVLLLTLAAAPDARVAHTLALGGRIEAMRKGGLEPWAIQEREGISRDQYMRALRKWRDLRHRSAKQSGQS